MSKRSRSESKGVNPEDSEAGGSRRLDKWLFCARFFRTRQSAAEAVAAGAVRRNAVRVDKPGLNLHPGDVLTIRRSGDVALVRVTGFAERREGAEEAKALYQEIGSDHAEPTLAPKPARP